MAERQQIGPPTAAASRGNWRRRRRRCGSASQDGGPQDRLQDRRVDGDRGGVLSEIAGETSQPATPANSRTHAHNSRELEVDEHGSRCAAM